MRNLALGVNKLALQAAWRTHIIRASGIATVIGALMVPVIADASVVRTCEAVFGTPAFDYAELELTHPEIEAKFFSNRPVRLSRLKNMIGSTMVLEGPSGEKLEYKVSFNADSVYHDVYLDTADLKLLAQRSVLRRRTRFDRAKQTFEFVKGVHHAKGNWSTLPGLESSIVARDEIRGTEFQKEKKFARRAEEIFSSDRQDNAFDFARSLVSPGDGFQPVLSVESRRTFVKLEPLEKGLPQFYISIDKVQYRRTNGAFNERTEVEAEIIDDLSADPNSVATYKVKILSALSEYMRREFGLQADPRSKYESGMALTGS